MAQDKALDGSRDILLLFASTEWIYLSRYVNTRFTDEPLGYGPNNLPLFIFLISLFLTTFNLGNSSFVEICIQEYDLSSFKSELYLGLYFFINADSKTRASNSFSVTTVSISLTKGISLATHGLSFRLPLKYEDTLCFRFTAFQHTKLSCFYLKFVYSWFI